VPPALGVLDMARVASETRLGMGYAAQLSKLQSDIEAAQAAKQRELDALDAELRLLPDGRARQAKEDKRQAFLAKGQAELNRMRESAQRQVQIINAEFQQKSKDSSRRRQGPVASTCCWTRRWPSSWPPATTSPRT